MAERGRPIGAPDRISPKWMESFGWISTKSIWYVVKVGVELEVKLTSMTGQRCDGSCQVRRAMDTVV